MREEKERRSDERKGERQRAAEEPGDDVGGVSKVMILSTYTRAHTHIHLHTHTRGYTHTARVPETYRDDINYDI